MSLFLGILAAAVLGGAFTVYPWGSHSRSQMVIAIVLWVVGASLASGAGYLEHKGRKQPKGDGSGARVDPRESLEQMLIDAYQEGVAINGAGFVADMERDAPPWQKKVGALLRESLVDQGCWLRFKQMGPESGHKLNTQLWNQTRYLEEILQNFPTYVLRATWRPPTPVEH